MKRILAICIALAMTAALTPVIAIADNGDIIANLSFDGGIDDPQIKRSLGGGVDEGVIGDAALFTGSPLQYLNITDKDGNNNLLVGKNAVTIMFWEKRYSGIWPLFIGRDTNPQKYGKEYYLALFDNGSEFKVERYCGGRSNTDEAKSSPVAKAPTYPEAMKNGWKHVAIVLTDNRTDLYVNGQLAATAPCTAPLSELFPSESYVQLGRGNWGDGETFNGYIDEFKIIEGELSAEEIAAEAVYPELTMEKILGKIDIPNPENVLDSINLVSEVEGVPVKWTSSDTKIVTDAETLNEGYKVPAGSVTRGDNDENVTLTAQVSYNGQTETKTFDLTVKARDIERENAEKVAYLYAYFRGFVNGGTEHLQIHVATSTDGYKWTDLNGNWPILTSDMGTTGLRDPYIIRSRYGDKFYLIATDLNTLDGNNQWARWSLEASKYLAVWESEDLVNWSEQRLVKFANDDMGCAWAPEAIYDEETDEYLVYAAGKDLVLKEETGQQFDTVYVARTRDFRSFSEPEFFVGKEADGTRFQAIDSSIIQADDGKYYHFFKKHSGEIHMMVSDHASGPYTEVSAFSPIRGEGPAEYKVNGTDQYCLCVDNYSVYVPYLTDNIASGKFTQGSGEVVMPTGSKHGTFVPLTQKEYDGLMAAYGPKETDPDGSDAILSYDFETPSTEGLNGAAKVEYDEERASNVLTLDGTDGAYFAFPESTFDHRDTFTLSMDVKSNMTSGNFFTFGLGSDAEHYLLFKDSADSLRASMTISGYSYEDGATAAEGDRVPAGEWAHFDLVVEPGRIAIYKDGYPIAEKDGIQVAENAKGLRTVSHLGVDKLNAYLGKSIVDGDLYFNGSFDNVKLYNRALSPAEIAGLDDNGTVNKDPEYVDFGANINRVTGNITLPSEGMYGSSITWETSDPAVIGTYGTVNRPAQGEGDAYVTLTGTFKKGDSTNVAKYELTVKEQTTEWVSTNDFSCKTFDPVSGEVYINFDITPKSLTDGLVGIASSAINPGNWGDYNIGLRIQPNGTFDAHNGSGFAATNTVNYEPGKTYHVTVRANTADQKFSFYVTDENGVTSLVADNFSYRNKNGTDLTKVNVRGGNNIAAGLFIVEGFTADRNPVTVAEAKVYDGTATYKAVNFGDKQSLDMFIAYYNADGGLLGVDMATPEIGGGQAETLSGSVPEGCAYVKLFTWKDDSAEPLANALKRTAAKN